ncbi:MAG: hypothetical protein GEU95_24455 [Rhizobiales bacterium]|nr:hypothetical protein [Hyphomicrobiales bacterium]
MCRGRQSGGPRGPPSGDNGTHELIGSAIERIEDLRILRGRSEYVDDVTRPGLLHAAILRSQVAHGRIGRSILLRRVCGRFCLMLFLARASFTLPGFHHLPPDAATPGSSRADFLPFCEFADVRQNPISTSNHRHKLALCIAVAVDISLRSLN